MSSEPDNELSTLRISRTVIAEGAEPGDTEAHLIVLAGHALGRRYLLGESMDLGRGTSSPIEILDDGVSRRHARIERDAEGAYHIFDRDSRNGTYVNGKRIESRQLHYGDQIALGSRTVLLFAHRDRFEDQRIQAQKLQALGQLAGGVAHDFNNLLGVVIANVSYLQALDRIDGTVTRETLAEIETAARRAVDLTHQLLAFARSSQRRNHPTDIARLVDDATRLLRRTLHRAIEIRANAVEGMAVVGDSSQLLQVLMNLCINAGDAMPGGGVLEIVAGPRVVEGSPSPDLDDASLLAAGDYVSISVRDEGSGMDEATRERIFEPFFTTKPRGKGTGLGLATAYAIVRDHGGHIQVRSEAGVGTTFEVLLPRTVCEQLPQRKLTEAHRIVPASGVVLLADDEPLVRRAARRVLEHADMEVIEAADGLEAVEVFRGETDRVDLVVLDLDMPRMDGEKAFHELRTIHPGVKVLISSGYVDRDREVKLREAGVDGILHKPYDSLALVQAIAQTLDERPAEEST